MTTAPLVVGVIDSGVHADHPHIGAVAGGVGFTPAGDAGDDYLDRLGHGTAVAAAIQDVAPDAEIYALKIFGRSLDTSVEVLAAAIDWAGALKLPLVNLSLGSADPSHVGMLAPAVARARMSGTVIVAAGSDGGVGWLPGTLGGVVRTELDWSVARGTYTVGGSATSPIFRTSGYPRPIPGVDPQWNLKGLSFAVAGMTGIAARAMIESEARGVEAVVAELSRRAAC